jgi:Na+/melibiose symporter-like transporter
MKKYFKKPQYHLNIIVGIILGIISCSIIAYVFEDLSNQQPSSITIISILPALLIGYIWERFQKKIDKHAILVSGFSISLGVYLATLFF